MKKKEPESFTLAKVFDPKVEGVKLIQAGIERANKQVHESVVAFVTGTMQTILNLKADVALREQQIQFQQDRLNAINKGEFHLDARGRMWFNDSRLSEGL